MKKLYFITFILLISMSTSAYDFEQDGVYYNLITKSKIAEVTSVNKNQERIVVPSEVIKDGVTYNVTKILGYSFSRGTNLIYVEISEGIKNIDPHAFSDCTKLKKVILPNDIEIGYRAFEGCSSLEEINLPQSLKIIPEELFLNCTSLPKITIHEGVREIGIRSFSGCSNLSKIDIPKSLTSVDVEAFDKCKPSLRVNIDDLSSWCKIGFSDRKSNPLNNSGHLYLNNKEIIDLVIPESVDTVKAYSFAGCDGIKTVSFNDSIVGIEKQSFSGCNNLETINWGKNTIFVDEPFGSLNNIKKVNIKDLSTWCNVEFVQPWANPLNNGAHLFINNQEIKELVIPENISKINKSAFYGARDIEKVVLNNVSSIGQFAFGGCRGLKEIEFSNSLTNIEQSAFENCSNLENIELPESLISLGPKAFSYCEKLKSINIPSGIKKLDESIFLQCYSLSHIDFPNTLEEIGNGAFARCTELESVILPENMKKLNDRVFVYCEKLTEIRIGKNITYIGNECFEGCKELSDFYISSDKPTIGRSVFYGSYIEYATLHVAKNYLEHYNSTEPWNNFGTIIGDINPTYKLTYLVDGVEYKTYEIEYGSSINREPEPTLDGYTFSGWSEIPETMPDNDVTITGFFGVPAGYCGHNLAFRIANNALTISKIREGSGDMFNYSEMQLGETKPKNAAPWWDYRQDFDKIVIEEGVTSIGKWAFYSCDVRDVVISEGVEIIGSGAFYGGCGNTNHIKLPNSVKEIWDYAFGHNPHLMKVTLGENIENIYPYAFLGSPINHIYCYATRPPSLSPVGFDEPQYIRLYVPNELIDVYKNNRFWNIFGYILPLGDEEDEINGKCGDNLTWTYSEQTKTLTISGIGEMYYSIRDYDWPWHSFRERIQNVIVEDGVNNIGNFSFCNFDNLIYVSLPKSVKRIGMHAFHNCIHIETIALPSSLEIIDVSAFESCESLNSLIIPSSLQYIGCSAFDGCKNLIDVFCYANEPPRITTLGEMWSSPFRGVNQRCTLYVPQFGLKKYKEAKFWKDFTFIEALSTDDPLIVKVEEIGGHEYIDLGLPSGRLWSKTNFGAVYDGDDGEYLNWENRNIVNQQWGNDWGVPSFEDILELYNNCSILWDNNIDGVYGCYFRGKNGNSIFLPCSGYREKRIGFLVGGKFFHYWTDTASDNPYYIHCLSGDQNGIDPYSIYNYSEFDLPIRPIVISKTADRNNSHEYVDLGLPSGNLWSKKNYGSESEDGYGAYVGWDNRDVVSSEWGEDWSVPTATDLSELVNYCTFKWGYSNDGVYGCNVTGPNGYSLFLPAAGFQIDGYSQSAGKDAYYWSSTEYDPGFAFALTCYSETDNVTSNTTYNSSMITMPVRPVKHSGNNENPEKTENIKEYIDLGLPSGTLWSKANIGAKSESDFGIRFAFGETVAKEKYMEDSYKWLDQSTGEYTKYTLYGNNPDYKNKLESIDDAATQNWGEEWRTPGCADFEELVSNCRSVWETVNGVSGRKFIGNNGNSIFLPAAGYFYWYNQYPNELGYYMTSEVENNERFHLLYFSETEVSTTWRNVKYQGYSVRPIYNKNQTPIENVKSDNKKTDIIYDLNGTRREYPFKGLNIMRSSDGKTKKVMIK